MVKVGEKLLKNEISIQGSLKVPSGSLGQVDFLAGQETFKVFLSNGLGVRQVIL